MLEKAKLNNRKIIALDYSGFDTNIHPYLRDLANKMMVSLFSYNDKLLDYQKHQEKYNHHQFAVLPDTKGISQQHLSEGVALVSSNYQLLSGVINTQHDGSLINAMIQGYVAKRLGFEID